MKDHWPLFRGRIQVMPTIASHWPLNRPISETVRNRGLVPKYHQQEMAYGESNGHVTDNVTWPCLKGQTRESRPQYRKLRAQYLENSWRWYSNNRWLLDSLLWGSKVGYPSDNLTSGRYHLEETTVHKITKDFTYFVLYFMLIILFPRC